MTIPCAPVLPRLARADAMAPSEALDIVHELAWSSCSSTRMMEVDAPNSSLPRASPT